MNSKQVFDERDVIDFSAYMEETDHKQSVKSAAVYVQGLIDQIESPVVTRKRYMPWEKTRKLIQFRPGEVTVWGGENGGGKSLVTGQVALGLAAQGEKVCLASFEMKPAITLARMGRQMTGYDFEDEEILSIPKEKTLMLREYADFRDWTKGKIWLYDKQGTVKWPNVVAMARYAARELHVGHIFVDNLGKCVKGEDDYNGQKEFIDQICSVARDEDVHVHVVHHIRKPSTGSGKPNKSDFKGSGAITDQPDNVIAVWRNKEKEKKPEQGRDNSEADTLLIVDKQRNGKGWEGQIALWYEKHSSQFLANFGDMRTNFWGGL